MDRTNSRQSNKTFDLVLMWRGNIRAPDQPTNHAERLQPLIAALRANGVEPSPLVYRDDAIEASRERLMQADGALVWINPLQDGQDRRQVDALLRDVSAAGVWVSAHPEAILKLGTKEVLFQTQGLGWGSATDLYTSHDEFRLRFPLRLSTTGARVLKPLRGNDGQGVLKVAASGAGCVRVQRASDDGIEDCPLPEFLSRMAPAFAGGARLIDQAFEPNVGAGMVRCYMSFDRVVGFSEQSPRQLDGPDRFAMNSAKTMYGADAPQFQPLRNAMEHDWTPGLQRLLALDAPSLPALWDADFLHRSPGDARGEGYVLCEINVSSVLPFPEAAAGAIAANVKRALDRQRRA